MGLAETLTGKRVCIDTAPFIYYIEKNDRYWNIIQPMFKAVDRGDVIAITSTITLLEVLVHPIKSGDSILAGRYKDILLHSEGLTTHDIHYEISAKAAELRARYEIKTPDAIQIAVGILYGADMMITNDISLKKLSNDNLTIVGLDDYVG